MQISIDQGEGHQIRSYQDHSITIDEQTYSNSLIVTTDKIIFPWAVNQLSDIGEDDCRMIVELEINILVLGTGQLQQFLNPDLLIFFANHKIGVEVMTTAAACRTYNVLMSEQRRVAAALLLEP